MFNGSWLKGASEAPAVGRGAAPRKWRSWSAEDAEPTKAIRGTLPIGVLQTPGGASITAIVETLGSAPT